LEELYDLVHRVVYLGKLFATTILAFLLLLVQGCVLFYTSWLTVFIILLHATERVTKRVEYKEDPVQLSIL